MPQIPTDVIPQVAPQAAPTPQMPNVNAGGGDEAMGNALGKVAGVLEQIQDRNDIVRVQDAEAQAQKAKTDIATWVQTLKGKNALDPNAYGGTANAGDPAAGGQPVQSLQDVAAQKYQQAVQPIQDSLSNANQKRMFAQSAQRFGTDLYGQIDAHVQQQNQQYMSDVMHSGLQEDLDSTAKTGYANGQLNEAGIQQNLQHSIALINTYAGSQGWSDDAKNQAIAQAGTSQYGMVIQQMLAAHDVSAAQTYFQVHKGDMDAASPTYEALNKQVIGNTLSNQVHTDVQSVLAQGGTYQDMFDKVDSIYAANPIARDEARMEFRTQYQIHRESRILSTQDLEGQLWQMRYPTAPGAQPRNMTDIRNSPQWAQLAQVDGTAPDKLISAWEQFGKRNEADPSAQQAMQAQKFATYWAYASNPDALSKMTDGQILALTPQMGLSGVQDLLGMKQKLQMPGKVLPSSVDVDQLKVFGAQAGMNVYGTLSSDDQAKLGQLKYSVDQQVETQQQALKRELTRSEKDDIIKRSLVNYTVQGAGTSSVFKPWTWFGSNDGSKPAFELQPGDKLAIPAEARAGIVAEAQANGVWNPTEDQIQSRWFTMQQPKPTVGPQPIPSHARVPQLKVSSK